MTTADLIHRATTDLADLDIHADAPTELADTDPVLAIVDFSDVAQRNYDAKFAGFFANIG